MHQKTRIVLKRVGEVIEGLLTQIQFGFKRGISTSEAIFGTKTSH